MEVSFSSFITTFLFSSIIMILLYFLSKSNVIILKLGIRFIFLCMFLNIVKLLFPIEFSFTNSIYLKNIWPTILGYFNKIVLIRGEFSISLNLILGIVWIIGTVFLFIKLAVSYYKTLKTIRGFEPINNPFLQKTLNKICKNYTKSVKFHLVSSKGISTPLIFGIKNPYIAIPDIELEEKDWYYILSHEVFHYYHKDLMIKLMIELISAIYWWNPFFYLIKGQFYKMIEINVDRCVTKNWNERQKLEYLECLIHLAKNSKTVKLKKLVAAFKSNNELILSQRVHLIIDNLEYTNKVLKPWKGIRLFFSIILFILPIFYVLEPYSISSEDASKTFEINQKNAFFVQSSNNSFDLYLNNEYLITVHKIFDTEIKLKEELPNVKEK